METKSIKNNGNGWRSIAIDKARKIKVVGYYCRLKAESITQVQKAYNTALKSRFGRDKMPLGRQSEIDNKK